eukprot:11090449-Lingulodinium_polyedra.AAC.1
MSFASRRRPSRASTPGKPAGMPGNENHGRTRSGSRNRWTQLSTPAWAMRSSSPAGASKRES